MNCSFTTIKNKPGLSLEIAAACNEHLQMLTDYVNNSIDNDRDLTVLHIMLDSFIALTYQLRLTATECPLSELSMLRCFNNFSISILKINQDTGLQTQESAILNEEYLMEFYKIEESYYSPYSPSTRRAIKNNFQFNRGPSRLYHIRLNSNGGTCH